MPARHVLQCLLGTSYSACSAHLPTSACSALLSACSALLRACSALPTPQPQRQTLVVLRQDVPPHTHGSLTGNEKNSGVWGVHARHNQAKPCNTMQNQAKSCHAKIKQCKKKTCKNELLLRSVHTCTPCSNSVFFFNAKPCETSSPAIPAQIRRMRGPPKKTGPVKKEWQVGRDNDSRSRRPRTAAPGLGARASRPGEVEAWQAQRGPKNQ